MRKLLIILILVLAYVNIVNATPTCFASESCTLYGACKNATYANSTARISIYFPNTTLLVTNESMTEIMIGRFNYTFVAPEIIGNYLNTIECNIGGFIAVGEDEFTIGESKLIADELFGIGNILIVVLLFVIHLALVGLGFKYKATAFLFIGGALGVIAGLVGLAVLATGFTATAFFVAYTIVSTMFMVFLLPKDDQR